MISGETMWRLRRAMWLIGIVSLMFIWFIHSRPRGSACLSIRSSRTSMYPRCVSSLKTRRRQRRRITQWRVSITALLSLRSRRRSSLSLRALRCWVCSLSHSLLSSFFSSPSFSLLSPPLSKWKHARQGIDSLMTIPKGHPKSKPNTEQKRELNRL